MTETADVETFQGRQAEIAVSTWPNPEPRRIVVLAHGYGEHLGRYDHVAEVLVGRGAIVAGIETLGFTALEEVVYPGARHEVFNETNKDEVLARTADFVDRVTG